MADGIAVYSYDIINADEIQRVIDTKGYAYTPTPTTLNITVFNNLSTYNEENGYIKFDDAQIFGNAPQAARDEIINTYLNGVFIKYYVTI